MGAVQNFFPTKDRLLAAMLEYVANEYEAVYQRLFRKLPVNGEARLYAVIDYLVDDLWREDTRHFFVGLWALGVHDARARELINQMYAHHRRNIAMFIGGARPGFSDAQCYETALLIGALIEGLILFTAPRSPHRLSRVSLRRSVREAVARLIAAPAQPPT